MQISFHFLKPATVRQNIKLKEFILLIFKTERKTFLSLNVIFCSDEYLLPINEKFLQHNYFTDIITFNLAEKGSKKIEGEIYISIDRIRDNYKSYKTTFQHELQRVIFHGILHLCGYSDDTIFKKAKMTLKENFYLERYRQFIK